MTFQIQQSIYSFSLLIFSRIDKYSVDYRSTICLFYLTQSGEMLDQCLPDYLTILVSCHWTIEFSNKDKITKCVVARKCVYDNTLLPLCIKTLIIITVTVRNDAASTNGGSGTIFASQFGEDYSRQTIASDTDYSGEVKTGFTGILYHEMTHV